MTAVDRVLLVVERCLVRRDSRGQNFVIVASARTSTESAKSDLEKERNGLCFTCFAIGMEQDCVDQKEVKSSLECRQLGACSLRNPTKVWLQCLLSEKAVPKTPSGPVELMFRSTAMESYIV